MKIINEECIVKSDLIKSKNDLFELIATTLKRKGIIKNKANLIKDLKDRESLGSTAFENGLIIPHNRTNEVSSTQLVIVDFNNSKFDSIDGKPSNFAVSILVPKKSENEHIKILSKLSSLFSTKEKLEKFKNLTKKQKVKVINSISIVDSKNTSNIIKNEVEKYDLVAVTSCAAGIAHTYMARDAIVEAAKKMGIKVKVETRGSITENQLSKNDIENSKFVLIAADVSINKAKFSGKKLYSTDTNSAIKDGVDVINKAKESEVFYGKAQKIGKLRIGGTEKKKNDKILGKSIMSALSFMIPIVIAGGILMAIPNALAAGGNQSGGTWKFPNNFTEALWKFGHIGLVLMVPIFAMFLAFKIGGKPAMPAALLGGFFINDGAIMGKFSLIDLPKSISGSASAGFLGGLLVGIFVGYLVRLMQWIKWHRWIKPVSNLMIVPILSSFITFIFVLYVAGSPMTFLMAKLYEGLSLIKAGGIGASMGIGILFAILMAIDLGGPINKTTLTVATVIFADTLAKGEPNFVPQTAVQAAISVPPLGMWLSTVIFKKKFSISEINAGQAALPMGLVGVTEGALPFAFKTPLKAIVANIIGSALAGALVSLFQINFYGGLGSPLGAYVGYSTHNFYGLTWILAIICGAVTTSLIYGFLRKRVPEHEIRQKEIKKELIIKREKIGIKNKKDLIIHSYKRFKKEIGPKLKYCLNPKNWIQKPNTADEHEI